MQQMDTPDQNWRFVVDGCCKGLFWHMAYLSQNSLLIASNAMDFARGSVMNVVGCDLFSCYIYPLGAGEPVLLLLMCMP